jgi:hypothetical protein
VGCYGNGDGNDGNRPPTPAHPGHRPTRRDIERHVGPPHLEKQTVVSGGLQNLLCVSQVRSGRGVGNGSGGYARGCRGHEDHAPHAWHACPQLRSPVEAVRQIDELAAPTTAHGVSSSAPVGAKNTFGGTARPRHGPGMPRPSSGTRRSQSAAHPARSPPADGHVVPAQQFPNAPQHSGKFGIIAQSALMPTPEFRRHASLNAGIPEQSR